MLKFILLLFFIFFAGFVDSIAGGGGLISLPAYMTLGTPGIYAIATNKFSAFFGNSIACVNYIRNKSYCFKSLIPSVLCSMAGSMVGSRLSMLVPERVFFILLLIITPVFVVFLVLNRGYNTTRKPMEGFALIASCSLLSLVIGAYDGFYGPGSGTFLMMSFIFIAGMNVKSAGGNSRMVNWASNFGSLIVFLFTDKIVYKVGIPCALASIIGNFLGSQYALKRNTKIVKPVMIFVVTLLFITVLIKVIQGD